MNGASAPERIVVPQKDTARRSRSAVRITRESRDRSSMARGFGSARTDEAVRRAFERSVAVPVTVNLPFWSPRRTARHEWHCRRNPQPTSAAAGISAAILAETQRNAGR
jgi:hypothetical protein